MKKAMRCNDGKFVIIAEETNSVIAVIDNCEELAEKYNILGVSKPAMVLTFIVEYKQNPSEEC